MTEGAHLKATARVKLTKRDNATGEVLGVEEHEVTLTEEEARELWRSQMQD